MACAGETLDRVALPISGDNPKAKEIVAQLKSGGFDIGAVQPAFRPEKLWDYEVGVKSKMFDGRLQANLAGFYYDYRDLQISVIKNTVVFTQNAARARTYGMEAEIQAILAPRLKLNFSGSYLNAKFKDYVTANPDLPGAPVLNYAGYTVWGSRQRRNRCSASHGPVF
jgi:iron complex outermembrane receptor protein